MKVINILVHIPLFSFLLNVTGQSTICFFVNIYIYIYKLTILDSPKRNFRTTSLIKWFLGAFFKYVAERISHFCLVSNLIRPLGSTHNFTQSGWLILFIPDYLSGQHKLGKPSKHFLSQNNFVRDRRLTVCSSIAAAAAHHHEGSYLIYGPLASISLRPRVPSWIWIT